MNNIDYNELGSKTLIQLPHNSFELILKTIMIELGVLEGPFSFFL